MQVTQSVIAGIELRRAMILRQSVRTAAVAIALSFGGVLAAPPETGETTKNPGRMPAETGLVVTANDDFAMARTWQKESDLVGKNVVNVANESLGKIEDIVVDANSGRSLYAVLSFGGFMGVGDKLFAVPWSALKLQDDAKAFTLNVDKGRLKQATGFDKKQWPNFADETFAVATFKFYGQTPFWRPTSDKAQHVSDLNTRITQGEMRQRWYQRPVLWQKTSDLRGKQVLSPRREDLGKMSDLAIDPKCGRILYGIVSSGGKLLAVPFAAFTLPADARVFTLDIDAQQWKGVASFDNDHWPNLVDARWSAEANAYYHVDPYWTAAGGVKTEPVRPAGEPTAGGTIRSPDNTGVNARDRNPDAKTAGAQGQGKSDVQLTAEIRRRVTDATMSINGHNSKIVTQSGKVTLRGPVKDQEEKDAIGRIAIEIAGLDNVDNQLDIPAK
jgi:sporulation protein YlmC with PRC-barrel domain